MASLSKPKNGKSADKRAFGKSPSEDAVPYLLRQVVERLSRSSATAVRSSAAFANLKVSRIK